MPFFKAKAKVPSRFNKGKSGGGGGLFSSIKNGLTKLGKKVAPILKTAFHIGKKGLKFMNDHQGDIDRYAGAVKTGLHTVANATGSQKLQNAANRADSVIDRGQSIAHSAINRTNQVTGALRDATNNFKQLRAKR